MCGIFGSLCSANIPINKNILPHRGPDDWGVQYCDFPFGKLTLFQSRLSIIGLGEQGHQPFAKYPDYLLAYNGEIYNFKSIREQLYQECSVVFDTETDTEVLYEALIHWGENVTLDRLNGMFSFSFVDVRNKTMVLARDQIGIKPLYYCRTQGKILFASEVKVFFDLDLISPVLNRDVLGEYLANCWVYEPDTLFRDVNKLEAGCYLKFSLEDGSSQHNRYWDITGWIDDEIPDVYRVAKEQTIADVPVGAYFSGGIDSSILACCLKDEDIAFLNLKIGKTESKRVDTLKRRYDIKVEHIEPESNRLKLYEKLIHQMDEPIADPAILPAYLLAKKSREKGRVVMLSGMGGDEIDAGYTRHALLFRIKYLQWLRWIPESVVRCLVKGKRKRDLLRLKAFLKVPIPENYFSLTYYLTANEVSDLVGPAWRDPYETKIVQMCSPIEGMKRFFYLDMKGFLASHNLIYMDKASMAASVEVRVPLLDKDLARSMFAKIDSPQNCGKQRLKGILKSILGRDYQELNKEGFTYPLNHWVKDEIPWVEIIDYFRKTCILRVGLLEKWIETIKTDVDAVAMKLWTIYTLYVWIRAFGVKIA